MFPLSKCCAPCFWRSCNFMFADISLFVLLMVRGALELTASDFEYLPQNSNYYTMVNSRWQIIFFALKTFSIIFSSFSQGFSGKWRFLTVTIFRKVFSGYLFLNYCFGKFYCFGLLCFLSSLSQTSHKLCIYFLVWVFRHNGSL